MSEYIALIRAQLVAKDLSGKSIQQQINDIVKSAQANVKVSVSGATDAKKTTDGVASSMNNITKNATSATIATTKMSDTIGGGLFNNLTKIVGKVAQWGVVTGIVYGSLRQLEEGIQYIKDLNEQMTNIGLVTGQTTAELQGMASEFNTMAKELGSSTLDVAAGATEFIRQGRTMAETMDLLSVSTKLSKLGNLESADATSKLTAVLLGYNLQASEAIQVTDTLIALDNSFASSTEEIVSGMEKASSMASQAGVSYADLASYITVVQAKTQQSGETVGQAFRIFGGIRV